MRIPPAWMSLNWDLGVFLLFDWRHWLFLGLSAFGKASDSTPGLSHSQAIRLGLELDHWFFWVSSLPTHPADSQDLPISIITWATIHMYMSSCYCVCFYREPWLTQHKMENKRGKKRKQGRKGEWRSGVEWMRSVRAYVLENYRERAGDRLAACDLWWHWWLTPVI